MPYLQLCCRLSVFLTWLGSSLVSSVKFSLETSSEGFEQYLRWLDHGKEATIRSMASRLVEPVDQSSLNRFLTLYDWDEEWLRRRRLETLQSVEEMRWRGEGVTALDDLPLPKTGRKYCTLSLVWCSKILF